MHGVEDFGFYGFSGEFGVMSADGFGDLLANGHDGVEGGHGLLEDHGDVAAAVFAHGFGGDGEQVFSGKGNISSGLAGVREEAEDGERGGGFAGTGLAYEPEGLAGMDLEGDVLDGYVLTEADGKVGDFEKRRCSHW
jgi:hypothetical protein